MQARERFGYNEQEWASAKDRLRSVLIETAKRESLISYKSLSVKLDAERVTADSQILSSLLFEVTREEFLNGNGLLSAVVVKGGTVPFPGDGFFRCAEICGKKIFSRERLWIRELKHLYSLHRE